MAAKLKKPLGDILKNIDDLDEIEKFIKHMKIEKNMIDKNNPYNYIRCDECGRIRYKTSFVKSNGMCQTCRVNLNKRNNQKTSKNGKVLAR